MPFIISLMFESSVNSYDSQTHEANSTLPVWFESSVNSYDSQTLIKPLYIHC